MTAVPSSAVIDRPVRGRGFVVTFVAVVAGVLLLTAAATLWRDPFWVFRAAPPWTHDGAGASRLLDTQMRRVKPLQIANLRPGTLLVGSSVVYRGLDPRDLAPGLPRPVYNAGFSSLMAAELPVLAALARDVGSVRHVVIGLDYFMFTRLPPPPPLRPELASALGRTEMRLKLMFNSDTPENLRGGGQQRTEPGLWRGDGFKTTPDFNAALTRKVAAAQDIAAMVYEPERLAALDAALDRLRGLDIAIYLSPMNEVQLALLTEGGRLREFERWRTDIAAVTARHGLTLYDLTTGHPFDDFDPDRGSSRFWVDNVHFKPEVGRWVLAQLGLASGAVAPAP
ncbi:hypothetical protein ASE66_10940 [Bosea sp. Root483D1]|uniref:hypothetical protein n=1 Tax=Bosea sp. Root483D1 TaxID=1736544 RepID=UPI0007089610|nr:hypothetical protein [Bosea sp. Root483D1]KRE16254.1 hypothetical protein ASE66_10940 [Bosea sp. Root483D1]